MLEHPQSIRNEPYLADLPILDPERPHRLVLNRFAGGLDSLELTFVHPGDGPSHYDRISLGDNVVGGHGEIGERVEVGELDVRDLVDTADVFAAEVELGIHYMGLDERLPVPVIDGVEAALYNLLGGLGSCCHGVLRLDRGSDQPSTRSLSAVLGHAPRNPRTGGDPFVGAPITWWIHQVQRTTHGGVSVICTTFQ